MNGAVTRLRERRHRALMDSQTENLLAAINAAFEGVTREGGISLHEAEEIDSYGNPEDRARARLIDHESRWQDVPDEALEKLSSAPTFLDAIGFRYYLPALMTWSLKYGAQSDSSTPDNLLSLLRLRDRQEWLERLLTPAQLRATARFVEWALSSYWVTHDQQTSDLLRYWQRYRNE